MKIKNGYNSEEMEVRISGQSNGSIELWITMQGKETLSYMTLQELADLKTECELALRDSLNI